LLDALAAIVRAREAGVEWTQVSVVRRDFLGLQLGPAALATCAGVILLIGLLGQYVVARRLEPRSIAGPDEAPLLGRGVRDVRVLAMLGLVAAFLFTRLSFLTRLPVYVDESVHIAWGRSFLDANFAAEFSVGRWLPVRIMSLFLLLLIDVLFAARLGSVVMGLAVLAGCVLINRELFSSTEGLLAGIAYTVLPYALLYDRMALAVERELREYLTCGVMARGFARFRCRGCARELLVAFSCKGRGFCPSCCGRRMCALAAHLVDGVFGDLPVRQWVLTLPYRLRYALAYDHRLCRAVLAAIY
jgi:hypothetical protein